MNLPATAPESCSRLALLRRMLLVAIWTGAALGAADVLLHARELPPAEAIGAVGLYAWVAAAGALLATPLLALLLVLPGAARVRGRLAVALLWIGVGASALLLREVGRWSWLAVAALLLLVSAFAVRAWQRDRFAAVAPWRIRWSATLLLVAGLAATPPLLERAEAVTAAGAPPRTGGRPDLVLIVLDTQRADHLGAYGHPGGLTPAFDRFAQEGRLYERCYSPAPWTVPAHASLFTGLFPPSHGCSFEHHRWLDARFTTLAEALRDSGGYQTAAFVANEYLTETQLLQGFDVVRPLGSAGRRLALQPLFELLGWPARRSDHGAAEAVAAIGRFLAVERDGDRPLFLFVNLMEAHWRFLPALRERLAQTADAPGVIAATRAASRYYGPTQMASGRADPATVTAIRAMYGAAVQYQDRALATLLDQVDLRLGRERTLVAITADHGENLGDGGRFDHVFAVNDALLHVPLAIRWPAGLPAGGREPGLCQLVDVAPTLLSAAKIDAVTAFGEECAGRSLLPDGFAPRAVVLGFGDPYLGHLERLTPPRGLNRDVVDLAAVLRSVSDGERKLVRRMLNGVTQEQLFAVGGAGADRAESNDLATTEAAARAALAAQLDAELQALPAYHGPPTAPPEDPDAPEFDADALGQIGYARGR